MKGELSLENSGPRTSEGKRRQSHPMKINMPKGSWGRCDLVLHLHRKGRREGRGGREGGEAGSQSE